MTVLKIISVTDHQNEIDKICENKIDMKVTWAFLHIMPHALFANYGINMINTYDKDVTICICILILDNNGFIIWFYQWYVCVPLNRHVYHVYCTHAVNIEFVFLSIISFHHEHLPWWLYDQPAMDRLWWPIPTIAKSGKYKINKNQISIKISKWRSTINSYLTYRSVFNPYVPEHVPDTDSSSPYTVCPFIEHRCWCILYTDGSGNNNVTDQH